MKHSYKVTQDRHDSAAVATQHPITVDKTSAKLSDVRNCPRGSVASARLLKSMEARPSHRAAYLGPFPPDDSSLEAGDADRP